MNDHYSEKLTNERLIIDMFLHYDNRSYGLFTLYRHE